jgi:hypothetical protein
MSHSNHPCTTTPACILPPPLHILTFHSAPFPPLTPCVPYIPIRTSTLTHLFPTCFYPLPFLLRFALDSLSCSLPPLPHCLAVLDRIPSVDHTENEFYLRRRLFFRISSRLCHTHSPSRSPIRHPIYLQIESFWFRECITFPCERIIRTVPMEDTLQLFVRVHRVRLSQSRITVCTSKVSTNPTDSRNSYSTAHKIKAQTVL